MEIYTIGFTKKSAREFFSTLKENAIERLIDVRISNASQLAGYAKREDLEFFLGDLLGADYLHEPMLAPTKELLKAYRGKTIDWPTYAQEFLELLASRRVEDQLNPEVFSRRTVLLCSEPTQEKCHRRLVVQYLNSKWGGVQSHPL